MKLGSFIPWDQMENVYRGYFSDRMGRPAKDSRLICGLLVVKHIECYSDERVVEEYLENPYVQVFCGEETFVTEGGIEASLLSKMRKRLGKEFFQRFERDVLDILKRRRMIKTEDHCEMWKTKARTVAGRIVSLHLPHIRPIIRGKDGRDVEFGPKIVLSWVGGYGFLDALSFDAHNEGALWGESLDLHKKRFGAYPVESTGDGIFGTRANRAMLKGKGVRGGVKALRRSAKTTENREWLREKLKLRGSRMEGIIGHAKNNFGLDRIRYKIKDGEEMWIRLGLLAMNLSTAVKKMGQGGGSMGEARATA